MADLTFNPAEHRFYYLVYEIGPLTGCALFFQPEHVGDLNIGEAHAHLAGINKAVCIITNWKRITYPQYCDFAKYCSGVNIAREVEKPSAKILKLVTDAAGDEAPNDDT